MWNCAGPPGLADVIAGSLLVTLWTALADRQPPDHARGAALGAGLAAIIGGFDRVRPFHRFGLLAIVALVLLAAPDYWRAYGLDELPNYEHVNFWRLLAVARLAWLAIMYCTCVCDHELQQGQETS